LRQLSHKTPQYGEQIKDKNSVNYNYPDEKQNVYKRDPALRQKSVPRLKTTLITMRTLKKRHNVGEKLFNITSVMTQRR
jgi:hypothetical protein